MLLPTVQMEQEDDPRQMQLLSHLEILIRWVQDQGSSTDRLLHLW